MFLFCHNLVPERNFVCCASSVGRYEERAVTNRSLAGFHCCLASEPLKSWHCSSTMRHATKTSFSR